MAGQSEAKAQQNPQPQAPPYGRPVGFGVRFCVALAGRTLRIHAPGPGCQPAASGDSRQAEMHVHLRARISQVSTVETTTATDSTTTADPQAAPGSFGRAAL